MASGYELPGKPYLRSEPHGQQVMAIALPVGDVKMWVVVYQGYLHSSLCREQHIELKVVGRYCLPV